MSSLTRGRHQGLIRATVIMTYIVFCEEYGSPFFLLYFILLLLLLLHWYIVCNKHWLSDSKIDLFLITLKNSMISIEIISKDEEKMRFCCCCCCCCYFSGEKLPGNTSNETRLRLHDIFNHTMYSLSSEYHHGCLNVV